jgi:hypothetical protein
MLGKQQVRYKAEGKFFHDVFMPIQMGVFGVIQEFLEKNANPIDNT